VVEEAQAVTAEAIAFTAEHRLVPDLDGECVVGPAPPSRRWALAMMSWAAPYEADAPSRYYITPPEPDWTAREQEDWLAVFNRSSLPAITVHEVAPGHFAHGRSLRRAPGEVRRILHSSAFVEGWAHYAEEVCLDEGFRDGDPRFPAGVALEALIRVTRLAVSLGVHRGSMPMTEAVRRFQADAFLQGPAAAAEAARATYDPTYGRYTWGKLEILRLRDQARAAWGGGWVLVFLAVANSAIANANASANAATRTWFAMGRIRLLPRPFEHVNPRWRSPDVAVVVQFVVGVVVSVWLGLQYDPLTAFAIVGTIVTAVIIAIYMVVNLACLVFYLRERRERFNPLLHGLVPLLGIAAFVPALLTALGIKAFDFINALPYPISLVGPVVGIWFALGVVYLIVLAATGRDRLRDTAKVFGDEPAAPADTVTPV
jgi:hypothetical protein